MSFGIIGEITRIVIEWSQSVVAAFGYLGVFFASFIGSATVILPAPVFLAIFTAGSVLNPWLVGIIGGFGAALGELTGYAVGLGGKKIIEKKSLKSVHKHFGRIRNLWSRFRRFEEKGEKKENEGWMKKATKWFQGHGAFPVIVLFAATPLPDDVVGIICGAIRYDVKKFFLATLIGKIAMMTALAWGGFYGMQAVLGFFGG